MTLRTDVTEPKRRGETGQVWGESVRGPARPYQRARLGWAEMPREAALLFWLRREQQGLSPDLPSRTLVSGSQAGSLSGVTFPLLPGLG